MPRRIIILLLTLAAVIWSCSLIDERLDCASLGLTIEFPEQTMAVRSDVGELPASVEENAIHSLTIWVFRTDNHASIVSRTLSAGEFPMGGGARKYNLPVSTAFAQERPPVDVYVLANAASVGSGLDENSGWEDVSAAAFGGDYFGIAPDKVVRSVSTVVGLPMSGVAVNKVIRGQEPTLSVETVKMVRAVSKLHYVFCQTTTQGTDGEKTKVHIDNIELDPDLIPTQEYLFSESGCSVVPGSYEGAFATPGPDGPNGPDDPDNIAENDIPEQLVYVNQTPQAYEALIADAIAKGELTDCGTAYLRESDKPLTGTVYYTVTKPGHEPEQRTRRFSMQAPFSRNHSWTLFGYFASDRSLVLSVGVLPWDKNVFSIDFSTSTLVAPKPFTVDGAVLAPELGKDHRYVYVTNKPVKGYIVVMAPAGGEIYVVPEGDTDCFDVTPSDPVRITPTLNNGRIDITVAKHPGLPADYTRGKSITLTFKAFTPGGDRPIPGDSELIDLIYHFVL